MHAAIGFVSDRGIPLLIAVLGLLAALAGTWGATATADNNDLEDAKSSLEDRSDRLSEENEALATDLDQVTEDRDRWKERAQQPDEPDTSVGGGPTGPDDPDESTTATTTPRPGRTSTVLRQTGSTPITFASNYGIDLDTDAPDWGVNRGSGDLQFSAASTTRSYLYTYEMSFVDHVPTEAECDDATVLQSSLTGDQTREGVQMCVRTSEERFAYVHIVTIDYEAQTITLDLIVWE